MRSILSALAFVFVACPAAADLVMTCQFPEDPKSGWVNGTVAFSLPTGAKEATVDSDYIAHFIGKQVQAKVTKDEPGLVALTWEVKTRNSRNQYTRMRYDLVVKDGEKARYRARPLSYPNQFENHGTCKKLKG